MSRAGLLIDHLRGLAFVSIVDIRCQVRYEKRWNQTFVNKFVKVRLFDVLLHNKFNISGSLSENDFLWWVPSSQRQGGEVPEKMYPYAKMMWVEVERAKIMPINESQGPRTSSQLTLWLYKVKKTKQANKASVSSSKTENGTLSLICWIRGCITSN